MYYVLNDTRVVNGHADPHDHPYHKCTLKDSCSRPEMHQSQTLGDLGQCVSILRIRSNNVRRAGRQTVQFRMRLGAEYMRFPVGNGSGKLLSARCLNVRQVKFRILAG